jgi:putative redox protein
MAAEIKTAKIKWIEKLKFIGTGHTGRSLIIDVPEKSGGDGSAVTPGELLLIGLGGCTAVDVITMLNKMRVPLRDLQVEVEAEPEETYPKIYKWVKIIYKFYGCGDQAKAKKAVGMSKEKYCSVSAIVGKSAKLSHELVFED